MFSINNRDTMLAVALFVAMPVVAQDKPADNTANNKDHAVTAQKQSNAKSDTELTKRIRKTIVEDKSLSTYAHNVKVVTRGGQVTLKGPVRSEQEKAAILQKTKEVAGDSNIKDEITIAPEK